MVDDLEAGLKGRAKEEGKARWRSRSPGGNKVHKTTAHVEGKESGAETETPNREDEQSPPTAEHHRAEGETHGEKSGALHHDLREARRETPHGEPRRSRSPQKHPGETRRNTNPKHGQAVRQGGGQDARPTRVETEPRLQGRVCASPGTNPPKEPFRRGFPKGTR